MNHIMTSLLLDKYDVYFEPLKRERVRVTVKHFGVVVAKAEGSIDNDRTIEDILERAYSETPLDKAVNNPVY